MLQYNPNKKHAKQIKNILRECLPNNKLAKTTYRDAYQYVGACVQI